MRELPPACRGALRGFACGSTRGVPAVLSVPVDLMTPGANRVHLDVVLRPLHSERLVRFSTPPRRPRVNHAGKSAPNVAMMLRMRRAALDHVFRGDRLCHEMYREMLRTRFPPRT